MTFWGWVLRASRELFSALRSSWDSERRSALRLFVTTSSASFMSLIRVERSVSLSR